MLVNMKAPILFLNVHCDQTVTRYAVSLDCLINKPAKSIDVMLTQTPGDDLHVFL